MKIDPQVLKKKVEYFAALDTARQPFKEIWRDLADYMLPTRYTWLLSDKERKQKLTRNPNIIDATATQAARILASGMLNGITSPSRPWFKLRLKRRPNEANLTIRRWLDEVEQRMLTTMAETNFYNSLAVMYLDLVVFGTAAVGAGVTFYDARFRRVSLADRNNPSVMAIADTLRGLDPAAQLATVQREVLGRVRWSSDLDNMHVADFWSNAGETLQRGTGDSEDIAIVEMQALKAAGFNSRDLYISIGRQKPVGGHIVLLARTPQGFVVLDDRIGHPMAATDNHLFTPVLTIGEGKSWVHGRRVGGMTLHASAR